MILDHTAKIILYPSGYIELSEIFIGVGRSAFFIFSFIITRNYVKFTHSKIKYIIRLFIFGLISQIPYYYAFENINGNIFFTFALALSIIYLLESERIENYIQASLIFLFGSLFVEYNYYGVILIFIIYLYHKNHGNKYIKIVNTILIVGVFVLYNLLVEGYFFWFLALPLIIATFFWDEQYKKKSKIKKYFFYFFYPIHLIFLYMLSLMY